MSNDSYLFGPRALWKLERILLGMQRKCEEAKELAVRRRGELAMYDDAIRGAQHNLRSVQLLMARKKKFQLWREENQQCNKYDEYKATIAPLHTFLVLEVRLHTAAISIVTTKKQLECEGTESQALPSMMSSAESVISDLVKTDKHTGCKRKLESESTLNTNIVDGANTTTVKDEVEVEVEDVFTVTARNMSPLKKIKSDLSTDVKDDSARLSQSSTTGGTSIMTGNNLDFDVNDFQSSCIWFETAQYLLGTYNGVSPSAEWQERYQALRRTALCCAREWGVFQKELATPAFEDVFYCSDCALPLVHASSTRLVCPICGTREENNDNTVALSADTETQNTNNRGSTTKAQTAKFNFKPIPVDQAPRAQHGLKRELRLQCFRPTRRTTPAVVKNALKSAGMPEFRRYALALMYWLNNDDMPSMSKEQRQQLSELSDELEPVKHIFKDSSSGTCNLQPLLYRMLCLYLARTDPSFAVFPSHYPLPKTTPKLLKQMQVVKAMFAYIGLPWPEETTQ